MLGYCIVVCFRVVLASSGLNVWVVVCVGFKGTNHDVTKNSGGWVNKEGECCVDLVPLLCCLCNVSRFL